MTGQAEAAAPASLAAFDGAVLTALKEAEQALSDYAAKGDRNARLWEACKHSEAAHRLADRRYHAGSIGCSSNGTPSANSSPRAAHSPPQTSSSIAARRPVPDARRRLDTSTPAQP